MAEGPDVKGKRVLITGASRGLGQALAAEFARAGARLGLCARGEEALAATAAAVRVEGASVRAASLDVADEGAIRSFVGRLEEAWGGVDVLVNNASLLGPRVPLRDHPIAEWRQVLDVNLTGTFLAAQAVLPGMRRRGDGSIINVSSGVGNQPRANWGAYAVSKWAVEALTYNLALEEADAGVRANVVDPGSMRTAMRRAAYPDEDPAKLREPRESVGVFLWLASDASRHVSGQRFQAQLWRAPDRA